MVKKKKNWKHWLRDSKSTSIEDGRTISLKRDRERLTNANSFDDEDFEFEFKVTAEYLTWRQFKKEV